MNKALKLSSLKVNSFVTRYAASHVKGGRAGEDTLEPESSCIQDYCTFDCEGTVLA